MSEYVETLNVLKLNIKTNMQRFLILPYLLIIDAPRHWEERYFLAGFDMFFKDLQIIVDFWRLLNTVLKSAQDLLNL